MPLSLYYAVRQPLVEQALFVASELLHAGANLRQIQELRTGTLTRTSATRA